MMILSGYSKTFRRGVVKSARAARPEGRSRHAIRKIPENAGFCFPTENRTRFREARASP
jgi:hypothetical protein